MSDGPIEISAHAIHLGLGATAEVEPEFTGEMSCYDRYRDRHADDGVEGRLVTMHAFTEPWDVWEMHPNGSEVVLCADGRLTLHQQKADGATAEVTLAAGEYTVNEPGTWHRRRRSVGDGAVHHRRCRHRAPPPLRSRLTRHRHGGPRSPA